MPEILIKYSNPPKELIDGAKTSLKAIAAAADVKKGKLEQPHFILKLSLIFYSTTKVKVQERTSRCPKAPFWTRRYRSALSSRRHPQDFTTERCTRVQTDTGQRRPRRGRDSLPTTRQDHPRLHQKLRWRIWLRPCTRGHQSNARRSY